jgi:hypothetical protein
VGGRIILILNTQKWGVVPWKGPDDVEAKLKTEFHTHTTIIKGIALTTAYIDVF